MSVWVHNASFSYRIDSPPQIMETLWVERPGWGYLKRRDLWIRTEVDVATLESRGFRLISSVEDGSSKRCRYCGMFISSIPGFLQAKHNTTCARPILDDRKIEEAVIDGVRMAKYEQKIIRQRMQEQLEQEEMERKDRQDRIKEEMFSKQQQKDRKKRLRQQTREELRNK